MRMSDWSSDVCSSDLAAARNDDVDQSLREQQRADRGAVLRRHELHRVDGQARLGETRRERGVDRAVRLRRLAAAAQDHRIARHQRSEEHTSELQSLMRISYAVFCLKKKNFKKQFMTFNTFFYIA